MTSFDEEVQDWRPGSPAAQIATWFAFLPLTFSSIALTWFMLRYKGPSGQEDFYHGYREQNMLSVFTNLWCAVPYLGKIIWAHSNNPDAYFAPFTTLRYCDYVIGCPILTLDLMWNLEAPYKFTSSLLVATCLTMAVATYNAPSPENYVWFGSGLSLFIFTYTFILRIVRQRLEFFTECAKDAAATKAITYLKGAMFSYFAIWIWFPVLFLVGDHGVNYLSHDTDYILHCLLDVVAKSCYGFAILYFKVFFDRKLLETGVNEDDFVKFSRDVTSKRNSMVSVTQGNEAPTPPLPQPAAASLGPQHSNNPSLDSHSFLKQPSQPQPSPPELSLSHFEAVHQHGAHLKLPRTPRTGAAPFVPSPGPVESKPGQSSLVLPRTPKESPLETHDGTNLRAPPRGFSHTTPDLYSGAAATEFDSDSPGSHRHPRHRGLPTTSFSRRTGDGLPRRNSRGSHRDQREGFDGGDSQEKLRALEAFIASQGLELPYEADSRIPSLESDSEAAHRGPNRAESVDDAAYIQSMKELYHTLKVRSGNGHARAHED